MMFYDRLIVLKGPKAEEAFKEIHKYFDDKIFVVSYGENEDIDVLENVFGLQCWHCYKQNVFQIEAGYGLGNNIYCGNSWIEVVERIFEQEDEIERDFIDFQVNNFIEMGLTSSDINSVIRNRINFLGNSLNYLESLKELRVISPRNIDSLISMLNYASHVANETLKLTKIWECMNSKEESNDD